MVITKQQRAALEAATTEYQTHVAEAADYLKARGITGAIALTARLGVVRNPHLGHDRYEGLLAIPYITPTGVVDIRFRCPHQHDCKQAGHPKYQSQPGHPPRLYNTPDLIAAHDTIAITEGELDALILSHHGGIPTVGIAGAQAWQPHYPRIFDDYTRVLIAVDNDKAGNKLAHQIQTAIPHATRLPLPDDTDITDLHTTGQLDGFLNHLNQPPTKQPVSDHV